tara:strand:+ start:672 stop:1007 length:336 start_codon:yes stop_codon:yes gene_type:complete
LSCGQSSSTARTVFIRDVGCNADYTIQITRKIIKETTRKKTIIPIIKVTIPLRKVFDKFRKSKTFETHFNAINSFPLFFRILSEPFFLISIRTGIVRIKNIKEKINNISIF